MNHFVDLGPLRRGFLLRHECGSTEPRQVKYCFHRASEDGTLDHQSEEFVFVERDDANGVIKDEHFVLKQKLIFVHEQDFDEIGIISFG